MHFFINNKNIIYNLFILFFNFFIIYFIFLTFFYFYVMFDAYYFLLFIYLFIINFFAKTTHENLFSDNKNLLIGTKTNK